jgi:predicted acyltransferase
LPSQRLVSIDQLRGYAIFGMVLVNILGMFEVIPWMLKHHHVGMSYADTIAPLFVFVVGIGFRMSVTGGYAREGQTATHRRMIRRYAIIIALGAAYGGFDFETGVWDALMDIGCAGMLCLPVIGRGLRMRLFAACGFLLVYQLAFSLTPYGAWTMSHSINGGPLGPVAYAFVLLLGTTVNDLRALRNPNRLLAISLALAAMLTAAGWGLRMEWAGIKVFWPFSQFAMTAPYVLYSTGLAFLAFAAFHVLCDRAKLEVPHLSLLGQNPLVIYLLQAGLVEVVDAVVPGDVPMGMALLSFGLVYATCYSVAWILNWRGIVVKV